MIPSQRVYWLLLLGMALAPHDATVWDVLVSIFGTLIFDGFVLGLMVVDGFRVQSQRVRTARQLPPRLSIGRDNPVMLSVQSGARPAKIQIRDYYPASPKMSQLPIPVTSPWIY